MASLQQKKSGKYKYWQIVESRRVNGKPRPIVLAHLGTADALLQKLQGLAAACKIKSYSHGAVAALLCVAEKLQVPAVINPYVAAPRSYMADRPLRNGLTVGATLLLGAIGKVCSPTSKRGWWPWAKTSSLEYLLRHALSKVDSQHFWDLMDALPVDAIERIEEELLKRVRQAYSLDKEETLYFDTTNFFTFIATNNERCTVAQRGKNKQKRSDLRQVGLAMVVTPKDYIPVFHLAYQGNRNDCKVFEGVLGSIRKRMLALGMDLANHTLVFDRGNNSKKNMALVAQSGMHYVGALTPYHHKRLLADADGQFEMLALDGQKLDVYRSRESIWGEERTVLVFLSERLKAGQLRGVYRNLEKKQGQLRELQESLMNPGKTRLDKEQLQSKVEAICKGQHLHGLLEWAVDEANDGRLQLDFRINQDRLDALEDKLGFRILMTDRHGWSSDKIIRAFYGQAFVEQAFKNIKNPYHLTLKPQFHWTDQKIRVHYFMCVLGYLLCTLLWKQAREKANYNGTLDNLLDRLNNIRLATLIEKPKGRGKPKVTYQFEEMDAEETALTQALGFTELHLNRPRIQEIGVYTDNRL